MSPDNEGNDEDVAELEEAFDEEIEFAAEEQTEKRHNVLIRLYRGETSFDYIGHRKIWFGVSALVILLGLVPSGRGASTWASTSRAASRGSSPRRP